MYIITGDAKGKKIKVPKGNKTRPTSSRVKKSIFDTIGNIKKDTSVLDIFAGSGSLGIEALSRGAKHSTFIENDKNTARYLRNNLIECGYIENSKILNFDFKKALSILKKNNQKFELIFIDPPYDIYNNISLSELIHICDRLLKKEGMLIIEHNIKLDDNVENFKIITKKYGGTSVSFIRRED
ncbi:MAG: 16S rRNA (guanine(966)-N(2))-methyltransferase RsmD [Candidatus Dadabacteria bacterium]|nr:16S rRNA (guanine(966)-N(2))-methyltransferase RsmD [Candidatus Dadabacteria bacterium]NIQ13361.1 16S rRNA (guanine(966)-N(2))-methyltransferase RsmD [Candidatus Dadabacteria bacterium]